MKIPLASLTFTAGLLASALAFAQAPAASATPAQQTPAPVGVAAAPEASAKTASADQSEGKVAYYGRKFDGRRTASGERFNSHALTMAHRTLPMGTMVRVTNLSNHKAVIVRVNDRGPSTPDRIGDLSFAAASKVRMLRSGVVAAKLDVVGASKAHKASKRA